MLIFRHWPCTACVSDAKKPDHSRHNWVGSTNSATKSTNRNVQFRYRCAWNITNYHIPTPAAYRTPFVEFELIDNVMNNACLHHILEGLLAIGQTCDRAWHWEYHSIVASLGARDIHFVKRSHPMPIDTNIDIFIVIWPLRIPFEGNSATRIDRRSRCGLGHSWVAWRMLKKLKVRISHTYGLPSNGEPLDLCATTTRNVPIACIYRFTRTTTCVFPDFTRESEWQWFCQDTHFVGHPCTLDTPRTKLVHTSTLVRLIRSQRHIDSKVSFWQIVHRYSLYCADVCSARQNTTTLIIAKWEVAAHIAMVFPTQFYGGEFGKRLEDYENVKSHKDTAKHGGLVQGELRDPYRVVQFAAKVL